MNLKKLLEDINAKREEGKNLVQAKKFDAADKAKSELDELEQQLRAEMMFMDDELSRSAENRVNLQQNAQKINKGQGGTTIMKFGDDGNEVKDADMTASNEYRTAFMKYVLSNDKMPETFMAAGPTKTTDIGVMIPSTVLNTIIEKLEATGMILSLITRTSFKGGVSIPTSNVKPVASWVAEGAGSNKQKKSTGTITFAYHKLRCAVSVTLETDEMALAAFEATLINNVVEAMVKAIEQAIVSGSGEGQPTGILTEEPIGGQSLAFEGLTYDSLVEAEGALPLEYENAAVWTMTKKTFMGYIGMKDAQGQPIARVDYGISGKPERTLLGRRVVLCNYLDSYATALTAGTPFAFLFNYSDYVLNTNYNIGIKKYEDNDTDDIISKSIMSVDGKVVDKGSLVVLKKGAARKSK